MSNNQRRFLEIINKNLPIKEILVRMPQLALPNWYLGAGCLAQTIWNHFHGYYLTAFINDYDIVYFDHDLSKEKEAAIKEQVIHLFADLTIKIDVVNQARVHLWYEQYFGYEVKQFESCEEAIAAWPVTATCIGITHRQNTITVFAPQGYEDLFNMVIRVNKNWQINYAPREKQQDIQELYEKKVSRWHKNWQNLSVLPFNS